MATLNNQSVVPQAVMATALEGQYCGDAWAVSLLTLKVGCVVAAFYALGRLIGNRHTSQDMCLLASLVLFNHRNVIYQGVLEKLSVTTCLYTAVTLLLQMGIASIRDRKQKAYGGVSPPHSFLKPMLFPSQTTHTRVFPTSHSFSYSYLLVGVPVGWEGSAGGLLAISQTQPAWFTVCSDDYLARGSHKDGLIGKLKDYLTSQGVLADRYPYAYLITAPRFFGFSFNPVSFWYLYDHTGSLSAMILEVNNTFDERRMYLLQRETDDSPNGRWTFLNSWSKDFHVSPFNDRSGSYSLTAQDLTNQNNDNRMDNRIVLHDEDRKPKIVARVFSVEPGLDPTKLSMTQAALFLVRWWWVGFMTNIRILREARVLWFKKLQLYYRPEVVKTSIGRNESGAERDIEPFFAAYLQELVKIGQQPIVIHYKPAAGPDRGTIRVLRGDGDAKISSQCQSLEVHVLTPAFYGEIVRRNSIQDVLERYCFKAADGEAMLYVSDFDLLQHLLRKGTPVRDSIPQRVEYSLVQSAVSNLREKGIAQASLSIAQGLIQRRPSLSSEFDNFVSLSFANDAYKAYLDAARSLLLADRIALGFTAILSFYRFTILLVCLTQSSRMVARWEMHTLQISPILSLLSWVVSAHVASVSLQ